VSEARPASQAEHVIVMRHAQSDAGWQGPDRERPLTAQGKVDAREAARAMHGAGHHPGPLLASTALRARQTAEIIAAELQLPAEDVHFVDSLYDATTDTLEVEIRALAEQYTLLTLVAHNPGVSELARILSKNPGAPGYEPGEWRYLPWPPRY
jgi:phosphohistidine phosphatase